MKKIYLLAFAAFSGVAFGQSLKFPQGPNTTLEAVRNIDRTPPSPVKVGNTSTTVPTVALGKKSFYNKIGTTFNDQQTNATIYRRVQLLSGGQVSATWTTSADASPYSTRGSGYNHFDGTSWGAVTNVRIESERTGFPEYVFNPTTSEEIITAHRVNGTTGAAGGIVMSRKGTGSTTWSSSVALDTTVSIPGVLWVQTAVSGDYMICIGSYTDSSSSQPSHPTLSGVKTPQVYSRYQFSTNKWLVKNQLLPGYDNTRVYAGGGDNYSIDANGNKVAILIGGLTDDMALWKSNDAGATWTKTIIDSFPVPAFDYVKLVDTSYTNDGSVHVRLDNNGKAHCFWGLSRVLRNASTTANNITYFPGTNGIIYWQEGWSLDSAKNIAGMFDENNNGKLDLATNWNDAGARYGNHSIATMPYATIDANGVIYMIYSSLTEDDISSDNKNFRDVYMVYSRDNGKTWNPSNPVNLTKDIGFNIEQIFASLSSTSDKYIHMTFMNKTSIGRYDATNNPGATGPYDIYYMKMDTADIFAGTVTGVNQVKNDLFTIEQNFPNPFKTETSIPVNFTSMADVNVRVMDLVGRELYNNTFEKVPAGRSDLNIQLNNLPSGIYLYSIQAGGYNVARKMIVE